jgi:hypothetical protein
MPRFALDRDIRFFESISKELVDAVIEINLTIKVLNVPQLLKEMILRFHMRDLDLIVDRMFNSDLIALH